MQQESFDFANRLPASAQDAMQRADDHADEDWKTVFDQCIVSVARKQPELTSDDALDEYEALSQKPFTHNLSAIGPAMKRAAADGILTSTHRVERGKRPVSHGRHHTVWKSNIYRPAQGGGI